MIYLPLDHNFPEPILEAVTPWMGSTRLTPIRKIDDRLTRLADRQLVIALHQLGYRGLVTNNYRMLQNPIELAAILKTKLRVFALQGVGDDPVRATGALLLDLPSATKEMESERPGVIWLRPRKPQPRDPWDLFERAARQRNQSANHLYSEVRISDEELRTPILD